MARTAARCDMTISNNATWQDAFRFGEEGDTDWDFIDKRFLCDIKGTRDDPNSFMSLSSDEGTIVVADAYTRLLNFNVDRTDVYDLLPVTDEEDYVYDLVMIDLVTSARTLLMWGKIRVEQGITQT